MQKRIVYADNAATTRPSPAAISAVMRCLTEDYGNPSGVYGLGRAAKRALESAREKIAVAIGAQPAEIYFTGGGTEADNWALKCAAEAAANRGGHIITSAVEHHAVTRTLEYLERRGFAVTYLPVDACGLVSIPALEAAIRPDTILITIMTANNEIGTVMPVAEIGAVARQHGILFHTDAVQAVGHIPINVAEMQIDMLSMAAHKFRGPKGVGALYIRKDTELPPLLHGGGQEKNGRSGTENVPGACGMAAALEEAAAHMAENCARVSAMRDRLIEGLTALPSVRCTGHPEKRLPGTASFVFECIEGEALVLLLDSAGICASSGSACASGSLDPSPVLTAIGLPHETARGSLRLSINECTTDADIDYILETLPGLVGKLRAMSPLWEDKRNGKV